VCVTPQEEKIARLALDPAAEPGEIASAADKLIRSWRERGMTVEKMKTYMTRDRIMEVEVVQGPMESKRGESRGKKGKNTSGQRKCYKTLWRLFLNFLPSPLSLLLPPWYITTYITIHE
jgi:hypothetical protein